MKLVLTLLATFIVSLVYSAPSAEDERDLRQGPPNWVKNQLPKNALKIFKTKNNLRQHANLSFQKIRPGLSKKMKIDGDSISLNDNDLIPIDILSPKAEFFGEDGEPEYYIPGVYKSKQDPSIIITKSSNGRLVSASKKSYGHSSKVVRVASNKNIYATIDEKDVDYDQISQLKMDDIVIPPNQGRNLRVGRGTQSNLNADLRLSKSEERHLQGGCSTFKVVEIGVYFDSYMCAAEGTWSAARDRVVSIVADASRDYEAFCKKLVIQGINGHCNPGDDIMRPYVDGTANSIAENGVLSQFGSFVGAGNSEIPSGDIVHFFSGKVYPNYSRVIGQAYIGSVCYSQGYNTGINEMSSWTTNDYLLSHESGHNLGANHDSSGIMGSSNSGFSANSVVAINNLVDSASCVHDELSDGSTPSTPPPPPPSSCVDDFNWPGYYESGVYDCEWLSSRSNQGYVAWVCDRYFVFRDNCLETCNQC